MKISSIFNLKKSQYELDFVDVDTDKDIPLFLDPFFISTRQDPWSIDSTRVIKSFFQHIIELINNGKVDMARGLFINLNEPNETCLGFSTGKPMGNGVGNDNADQIFDSLLTSKAVETGLVEDLEDSAIFIDGISRDKVSDATTNILRKNLIDYTINQCNLLGINLTPNVPSGFYWNPISKKWEQTYTERLVIDNKAYLLIPKIAVSFYKEYVDRKYYQHFVLNYLQGEHLEKNSSLVQYRQLKNGYIKKFVTKKDIEEKDTPFSKQVLRDFTQRHPEIFKEFRKDKEKTVTPITNEGITDVNLDEVINFLLESLTIIPPGNEKASNYHNLMIGILELIFYPNLTNPIKEKEINDGRKRIDITFDNSATNGFFYNIHEIHKIISRYVFVECKNYSDDPTNPELDQLSGRFSINSGKFGILVCRSISNKELMNRRCIDLWKQKNELIFVLCDDDIKVILKQLLVDKMYLEKDFTNRQRLIELS